MESLFSILPLVSILCVGIFVQAAAGFAAGLLIVPMLLWFGYSLPEAQCALLAATIPQNVWGVWTFRESIPARRVLRLGLLRIAFLPLGVWVVWSIDTLPTDTIRQIVGAVVLAMTVAIVIVQPQPRQQVNPLWSALVFPLSGFLQGVVGMGGPPMVFWIQAHDWSTRQVRGFLFAMFLVSIGPALGLLYYVFGDRVVRPGLTAIATTPVLLVATYFGLQVGTWLGRRRLRVVTLWLLALIGISALVSPWLGP